MRQSLPSEACGSLSSGSLRAVRIEGRVCDICVRHTNLVYLTDAMKASLILFTRLEGVTIGFGPWFGASLEAGRDGCWTGVGNDAFVSEVLSICSYICV